MYSFTKAQRLLKKKEYNDVFAEAKKIVSPDFIILYKPNTLGYARLGLALSKKHIAKAHDRNRIKRILRESFRLVNLPAVDIVVLAKPGVGKKTNSTIFTKLGQAWNKLTASCGV